MQQIISNIPLTCALIGVIGILYSLVVAMVIKGKPAGTEKMQQMPPLSRKEPSLSQTPGEIWVLSALSFLEYFFSLALSAIIGSHIGIFLAGYIGMRCLL
jgi:K(+)-stimulated pyrophosphate-energized sodium pump